MCFRITVQTWFLIISTFNTRHLHSNVILLSTKKNQEEAGGGVGVSVRGDTRGKKEKRAPK